MKKTNWLHPQKAQNHSAGCEAWWYGERDKIVVVSEKIVGATVVTTSCTISRSALERWLKEAKPKRKTRRV